MPFDVQILVRVTPLDIRAYANQVRELGAQVPTPTLRAIAEDHADYIDALDAAADPLDPCLLHHSSALIWRKASASGRQAHP